MLADSQLGFHIRFCFFVFVCLWMLKENHEAFVNVDFWYLPCDYDFENAPVIPAIFLEEETCRLDTSVEVHGENKGEREAHFLLGLTFLLFHPRCHLVH